MAVSQETEQEDIAIADNLKRIHHIRQEKTAESGQKAVEIAQDTVGILFHGEPEPETEKGRLTKNAAKARIEAGSAMIVETSVRDHQPTVRLTDTNLLPQYRAQIETVREALDHGVTVTELFDETDNQVVREMTQIRVEQQILDWAGKFDLNAPDKQEAIRPRSQELYDHEKKLTYFTAARKNFSTTPEMSRLNALYTKIIS